jgi:hypothetical protein
LFFLEGKIIFELITGGLRPPVPFVEINFVARGRGRESILVLVVVLLVVLGKGASM